MTIGSELRHLELANRHIAEAQARMAFIEDRIARSLGNGFDTTQADALMRHMIFALQLMVRHRLQVRRALAKIAN